ncbi:MAG: DUF3363 domain-containing protein [Litorimonas sp.]
MAQDDDFIIGGRKTRKSGSQGSPRPSTSKGGSASQSIVKLGTLSGGSMSFTKRLAKDMAIAKRSSGRRSYAKPSKPKTGRFNARGRGRTALAAGIGPNRSWQTFDGSNIRYRSRRAVVKVRVMKLRGGKARAAYSHLKYLQREGAGVERTEDLNLSETRGELYGPDRFAEYEDRDFLQRGEQSFGGKGDPHQFRLIISPEDGVELARDVYGGAPTLQRQTRDLMTQLEKDLGTSLDWVAVDHFDTAHPHTHVVVRGVTHDGKALNIAGDYIAEGIRGRYEEIITHELGLKCEHEILDDLARETKLNRVTTLDRAIIPRIDAASSVIDLRAGSFRVHPDSALNRHLLIGRMKHLETLGLAQPTDKGRWQLERHTFETLGDMHKRENITKDMGAAMKRAGINRMMQLHGREAPHRKITGRVIGKGLAEDESSGRLRLIIDGDDGYVHAVETGPETRASEARIGSVVEVGPAKLGPVDRTLLERANALGMDIPIYDKTFHAMELEKGQSVEALLSGKVEAEIQMHERRLQTLVKAGLARPYMRDAQDKPYSWVLAEDFETKVLELDKASGRKTGLKLLSVHSLEAQLGSHGATWLDRVQIPYEPDAYGKRGFGAELHSAVGKRQSWLVEQGLASREAGKMVSYERGYVQTLIDREVNAEAAKIAQQTGKTYRALEKGMRVEGTYTDRLELMSGPHAVVQSQRAFYLVPWRSVMEQERGRSITGTMRGKSVSWSFGRGKERGIGR